MKNRIIVLSVVFTVVITSSLIVKSIFYNNDYDYDKYDPYILAFKSYQKNLV